METPKEQKYEYFIIMDFESTCIKDMRINPQEVIEFPATLVATSDYSVVGGLHSYVRPVYKPKLSPLTVAYSRALARQLDQLNNAFLSAKLIQAWDILNDSRFLDAIKEKKNMRPFGRMKFWLKYMRFGLERIMRNFVGGQQALGSFPQLVTLGEGGQTFPLQQQQQQALDGRPVLVLYVNGLDGPTWYKRPGAKASVELLTKLCQFVGWEIRIKSDLTKKQIRQDLNSLMSSNGPLKGRRQFSVFAEGHGGIDATPNGNAFIWDKNGEAVPRVWFENLVKYRIRGLTDKVRLLSWTSCKTLVMNVKIPSNEIAGPKGKRTANYLTIDSAPDWDPTWEHISEGPLVLQEMSKHIRYSPDISMSQLTGAINQHFQTKYGFMKVTFFRSSNEDFRFVDQMSIWGKLKSAFAYYISFN